MDTFWQGTPGNPVTRPCCREILGNTGRCDIHQFDDYQLYKDDMSRVRLDYGSEINFANLRRRMHAVEVKKQKNRKRLKRQENLLRQLTSEKKKLESAAQCIEQMQENKSLQRELSLIKMQIERERNSMNQRLQEAGRRVEQSEEKQFENQQQALKLQQELDKLKNKFDQTLVDHEYELLNKDQQVLIHRNRLDEKARRRSELRNREHKEELEKFEKEKEMLLEEQDTLKDEKEILEKRLRDVETQVVTYGQEQCKMLENSFRNLVQKAGLSEQKLTELSRIREFSENIRGKSINEIAETYAITVVVDRFINVYVYVNEQIGFLLDQRKFVNEEKNSNFFKALYVDDKLIFGHIRDQEKLKEVTPPTAIFDGKTYKQLDYSDFIISFVYDDSAKQVPVQLPSGQYVQPVFSNGEIGFLSLANRFFHWELKIDSQGVYHPILIGMDGKKFISSVFDQYVSAVLDGNEEGVKKGNYSNEAVYVPLFALELHNQEYSKPYLEAIASALQTQRFGLRQPSPLPSITEIS